MKLQAFELRQASFSFYLISLLPSLHLRAQMHKKLEVVGVGALSGQTQIFSSAG